MTPSYPLSFPSPAKINVFLKIVGRREDGYHNLQTAFQFISCEDILHFSPRQDGIIKLSSHFISSDAGFKGDNNLIVKAAQALKKFAQQQGISTQQLGAAITLDKKLPIGGGIGGGSSNAATTLLVLNRLWGLNIKLSILSELGLALGADVPVFIEGQAAFAEGKGENLQSIRLPEYWYVLLKPKATISTAKIFQHQQLTRDSSPRTIRAFLNEGYAFKDLEQLLQIGNDCENLVRKLYPTVNRAIEALNEYAPARLTGTGACAFAPFTHKQKAEQALNSLKNQPDTAEWLEHAQVVKGLNRSPLHSLLAEYDERVKAVK